MSPSRNVLIPTHEFAPRIGGIGVYLEELSRAATAKGHQVRVIAPGRETRPAFPFRVDWVAMKGTQDWPCRLRMMRYLRDTKDIDWPSTTLVLGEPGPIRLWMHRRWLKMPSPGKLVLIFHGTELQRLNGVPHRRLLLRQLLTTADVVGVVSDWVKDRLLKWFPEVAPKIRRVPGAVRSNWQDRPPGEPVVENGCFRFLQVGRVHPRKGHCWLVRSLGRLPPDVRQKVILDMIGPVTKPGYLKKVERLAMESGANVTVSRHITEEELLSKYRSGYGVIMPSRPRRGSVEGLGLALLEGGHFGLPVIGSATGGIPEALWAVRTGLLVTPGDEAAMAAAIQRLVEDRETAVGMGRAGAQFVRDHFSWSANVDQLIGDKPVRGS